MITILHIMMIIIMIMIITISARSSAAGMGPRSARTPRI